MELVHTFAYDEYVIGMETFDNIVVVVTSKGVYKIEHGKVSPVDLDDEIPF